MNLPNKLTLARVLLVPVFMILMVVEIPFPWSNLSAAAVFFIAALTDILDGRIARKHNLITDFGKFMDPLADKFMIFGAMLVLVASDSIKELRPVMIWVALIVYLRELAVTSMRLVVSSKTTASNLAANILGKIKTVTQIVAVLTVLLEPVFFGAIEFFSKYRPLSYLTLAAMTIMTIWSGLNYLLAYSKVLDPEK
jgi:CDP-diacylglycerol--glycerol-3-phosphate 3-phosphatidyltransferase